MSLNPRLDLMYVVHNIHLMTYKSPIGNYTKIFASPPMDRLPNLEPLKENEERTCTIYLANKDGQPMRKWVFFESEYRDVLRNVLIRRAGRKT